MQTYFHLYHYWTYSVDDPNCNKVIAFSIRYARFWRWFRGTYYTKTGDIRKNIKGEALLNTWWSRGWHSTACRLLLLCGLWCWFMVVSGKTRSVSRRGDETCDVRCDTNASPDAGFVAPPRPGTILRPGTFEKQFTSGKCFTKLFFFLNCFFFGKYCVCQH